MFPETLIEDMAIEASLKIDGCRPNTLVHWLPPLSSRGRDAPNQGQNEP
jgi:hypothetical protein